MKCSECSGYGYVYVYSNEEGECFTVAATDAWDYHDDGIYQGSQPCPVCNGKGYLQSPGDDSLEGADSKAGVSL